jgi:hypothetical protein
MAEIPETAITWVHDTGEIHIDTRSAKVANKLRRLGVEPVTNDMPVGGYASFRTDESKVRIVLMAPREPQDLSEEEREVMRERMRAINTRSSPQIQPKEAH